jgi:phosphonate transport system substrate-binding protein
MLRRTFIKVAVAAAAIAGLAGTAQAQGLKELNFGIISTEASSNLKPQWTPFLADMEKAIGIKVNAFFAPDYAGIIEGMRFDKVQVAWHGNASAIQAVDRAEGEVFVQTVANDGSPGYWSLLVAHKDSNIKTIDDVLKNPGKLTFGNGDPNSTSGFLVPSYFLWGQNNVDIRKHFTRITSGSHETNALSVASKQVDVATFNTEGFERLKKTAPDRAANLHVVWQSPLIPSDPIVWRKSLSDGDKQKIKTFFLTYGTPQAGKPEAQLESEKKVLTGLAWAPFKESSNRQLLPIRQLGLFRDRLKIEADTAMSADEKAKKLAEIDAQLAALTRQIGA